MERGLVCCNSPFSIAGLRKDGTLRIVSLPPQILEWPSAADCLCFEFFVSPESCPWVRKVSGCIFGKEINQQ